MQKWFAAAIFAILAISSVGFAETACTNPQTLYGVQSCTHTVNDVSYNVKLLGVTSTGMAVVQVNNYYSETIPKGGTSTLLPIKITVSDAASVSTADQTQNWAKLSFTDSTACSNPQTLYGNQQCQYSGYTVKLIGVQSDGGAVVQVGDLTETIKLGSTSTLLPIKITISSSGSASTTDQTLNYATLKLSPASYCAAEGVMCGGIAGIGCCSGLTCILDGTYADAAGKCVKSTNTVPFCKDSDGLDYYVKGTITYAFDDGQAKEWSDYCITDDNMGRPYLAEGSCNGAFSVTNTYLCPNGCKEGACVKSTTNTAPKIDSGTAPALINANVPAYFSWYAQDPDYDKLSWSVDWGDGQAETGACIETTPSCTDSDNSPDYMKNPVYTVTPDTNPSAFVKGVGKGTYAGSSPGLNLIYGTEPNPTYGKATTDSYTTFYDHCASQTNLIEAFCTLDGKLGSNGINCPNGCSNGACIGTAPSTSGGGGLAVTGKPTAVTVEKTGVTTTTKPAAEPLPPYGYFTAKHIYQKAGRYTVKATVSDCKGGSDTNMLVASVVDGISVGKYVKLGEKFELTKGSSAKVTDYKYMKLTLEEITTVSCANKELGACPREFEYVVSVYNPERPTEGGQTTVETTASITGKPTAGTTTSQPNYVYRLLVFNSNNKEQTAYGATITMLAGDADSATFVVNTADTMQLVTVPSKFTMYKGGKASVVGRNVQINLDGVYYYGYEIETPATVVQTTEQTLEGTATVKTTAATTGKITSVDSQERVCPAVCVPMWKKEQVVCIKEPCNTICTYTECGSGCGPDGVTTFKTEEACMNQGSCTDSDGGKNYEKKGTLVFNDKEVYTDFCKDSTTLTKPLPTGKILNEMYCVSDNSYSSAEYVCPNGCKDGACIGETLPVERNYVKITVAQDNCGDNPNCAISATLYTIYEGQSAEIGNGLKLTLMRVYDTWAVFSISGEDTTGLERYIIKGGIDGYEYRDGSCSGSQDGAGRCYVYYTGEGSPSLDLFVFKDSFDATAYVEKALQEAREKGIEITEKIINGNTVLTVTQGSQTIYLWKSKNLLFGINSQAYPEGLLVAYLDKYPSDLGTESSLVFPLTLKKGWNLFSVPVASNDKVLRAFTSNDNNCRFTSQMWALENGKYARAIATSPLKGYWIKVADSCSVRIPYDYEVSLDENNAELSKGWNMIGSQFNKIEFSEAAGTCEFSRGPYWYNPEANKYETASLMEPGKGYIINAAYECTLGSGGPPQLPE